jgi:hypothetical protein
MELPAKNVVESYAGAPCCANKTLIRANLQVDFFCDLKTMKTQEKIEKTLQTNLEMTAGQFEALKSVTFICGR